MLYEAPDPFSRKVFIDRGGQHGVAAGSPVINEDGVLGQVTRVYPLSSEVTLLVDKDAAIPVVNTAPSTAARPSAAATAARWSCASWPATTTCRSAMCWPPAASDGVYPPGLPVAKVATRRPAGRLRLRPHHSGAPAPARRRAPRAGAGAGGRTAARPRPRAATRVRDARGRRGGRDDHSARGGAMIMLRASCCCRSIRCSCGSACWWPSR